jgi:hypothetical protein
MNEKTQQQFNAICDYIANCMTFRRQLAEEADERHERDHAEGLRRNSSSEVRIAAAVILSEAKGGCYSAAQTLAYAVENYDTEFRW